VLPPDGLRRAAIKKIHPNLTHWRLIEMRLLIHVGSATGVLMALVLLSGCSEPSVYPVKGQVMYNGKPMVGGGAISLIPPEGQAGKAAGGEIAADGTFFLSTYKEGDGSMPGEFRVVIHQTTEKEGENRGDGTKAGKATTTVAPADRIPLIYSDQDKSPLKLTVEKKNNSNIVLTLDPSLGEKPSPRTQRTLTSWDWFACLEPLHVDSHR